MKPETFLALESTFAQALSGAWKDRADQHVADLLQLILAVAGSRADRMR